MAVKGCSARRKPASCGWILPGWSPLLRPYGGVEEWGLFLMMLLERCNCSGCSVLNSSARKRDK
eukprot:3394948-Ditylum_brightwellii.AAC.1